MTPKAFNALFGRIGVREECRFRCIRHATPRLRLRAGQRRSRYACAASLVRAQQYPAHGALHRTCAGSVQEFLALSVPDPHGPTALRQNLELLWLLERDQDRLLKNLVQLCDGCVRISLRLKLYLGVFGMILIEIANPHYRLRGTYHRSHSHVLPLP
jgi:hypothetical protein